MNDVPGKFAITLHPQGWEFMSQPGQSLLEAARAAGIIMPSSCRNGTCRTCLCLMPRGAVSYKIEWPGLSREEKEDGYILPCVASAVTDVELEAPAAILQAKE
ncbi:2Fe-2S iron-sulfur cluster-binding protein [Undibacterium terreum]|uniref:Ferredoxin n=1 Tax=Undibacterium terreum TaxID=1224302 RepID=A0A916XFP2_9BURK|nr:2Fe-2S iron-sulfur cluster-binding protein [Undibacterium terreum]GGC69929.1 ferredoxin [Undibacterium terreum]